jgi:uncharacterized membrane protein YeaQ/YmgE (transglycosylase-associated protein family)
MLSTILQLGGLGNIIIGITGATAAAVASGHFVDAEDKNGKFDFWYQ